MDAIDRLALHWQFESFTREFQDESYNDMLEEFADAWRYKRNRTYIQMRIKELHECRPDLLIIQRFLNLFDKNPNSTTIDIDFNRDWSKFDGRKTKKEVYIGPEAYLQM